MRGSQGGCGGEDERRDVVARHRRQQLQTAADVVAVVLFRIGDGFIDVGLGSEVEDGIEGFLRKNLVQFPGTVSGDYFNSNSG